MNFLKIIIGIKIIKATPIPLPIAVNVNASKTTSKKPLTYGDDIGDILSINPIMMFNIVPIALINIIANSPISIPGK